MKLSAKQKDFEPCPEYVGRAVCVDVTEPERKQTNFGAKDLFRVVFEVDITREVEVDGKQVTLRWCVWSRGFTPNLGEKAAFRQFLKGWLGRDLTAEESEGFDTETLIGKAAFLVINHTTEKDEVYANITACTPHKPSHGDPLAPSGQFVRKKDRDAKKDTTHRGTTTGTSTAEQAPGTMRPINSTPAQPAAENWMACKVHAGRFKGSELRELSQESVQALITHWVPVAKAKPAPTAEDRRLLAALEAYVAQSTPKPADPEPDDVPY